MLNMKRLLSFSQPFSVVSSVFFFSLVCWIIALSFWFYFGYVGKLYIFTFAKRCKYYVTVSESKREQWNHVAWRIGGYEWRIEGFQGVTVKMQGDCEWGKESMG